MAESFRDTKHTKHIMRRHLYTRWMLDAKHITLHWCPTHLQLADHCSKNNQRSTSPTFLAFFLPDPIALSTAEAENNAACVATRTTMSVKMMVMELRGEDPDKAAGCPLIIDSKSAKAMAESFRDTKHTKHIMRRHLYTRWMLDAKHITLHWCSTHLQLADHCSKNNQRSTSPTFLAFCEHCEVPVNL